MQVHAIYENGRLTFQQPIRLKTKRIEVDKIIPDNCIDNGLEDEPLPAELAVGKEFYDFIKDNEA
jgi:hypothetical protein